MNMHLIFYGVKFIWWFKLYNSLWNILLLLLFSRLWTLIKISVVNYKNLELIQSFKPALCPHSLTGTVKYFLLQSMCTGMIPCHNISYFLLCWKGVLPVWSVGFLKPFLIFALNAKADILEVFFVLVQASTSRLQPSWFRNTYLAKTSMLQVALVTCWQPLCQ